MSRPGNLGPFSWGEDSTWLCRVRYLLVVRTATDEELSREQPFALLNPLMRCRM